MDYEQTIALYQAEETISSQALIANSRPESVKLAKNFHFVLYCRCWKPLYETAVAEFLKEPLQTY